MEELKKIREESRGRVAMILANLEKGKTVVASDQSGISINDPRDPPRSSTSLHQPTKEPQQHSSCGPLNEGLSRQSQLPVLEKGKQIHTSSTSTFSKEGPSTFPKEGQSSANVAVSNLNQPTCKSLENDKEIIMNEKVERLKAIEGTDIFDDIDPSQLCLVPGVVIPQKLKVPKFEKYDGKSCPRSHLIMYCRKMSAHSHNDELLIHFFQDSLIGPANRWYMQLNSACISSWKSLADSFLKQYKHNIGIAPDRLDLQRMEKKSTETFKEYAQRWRDTAAQVQPPLTDKELTTIFLNTLKSPFYDLMIGNASTNFSDIVVIGVRIEYGVRHGKIIGHASESLVEEKEDFNKKDENEIQVVSSAPRPRHDYKRHQRSSRSYNSSQVNYIPAAPINVPTMQYNSQPMRPSFSYSHKSKGQPKRVNFDPIPITYTELLPRLFKDNLLIPIPTKPVQPPYPKWYNPNSCCDYHGGVIGHSTEDCMTLKHRVQDLLKEGWLNF